MIPAISHSKLSVLTAAICLGAVPTLVSAQEAPQYPPMEVSETSSVPPAPAPQPNSSAPTRAQAPAGRPVPRRGSYGPPRPYGAPVPYGARAPYAPGPGYRPPVRPYGPYGGGYRNGPWGGSGPGNWFGGNRGPYGNNGPFGNWFGGNRGPYGNNGPFGNMFGGRGNRGIWGMNPDRWMSGDPEDGLAEMWDDMLNAPSEMGEMPGGWNAPAISVPNPVDVGSEFRDAAPDLARELPHMIRTD